MGRLHLTEFEAKWLYAVVDTVREIAADTLPHVTDRPPKRVSTDPHEAWDRIVAKIDSAHSGFVE